ncbi:MAG: glycosyltransferase [Thermomicrobiales bacterium]
MERTTIDAATSEATSRRILFYSHDGTGLGHLRITLGVARAYAQRRPDDSLLLLTGSLQTGAFDIPANLDFVKMPAMPKRDIYATLPPTEGFTGAHNSTIRFRAAIAQAAIEGYDPHLIVVDHAPHGLFQELAPAFSAMRCRGFRPYFALLMRDVTFGPEQTRHIWTNEEVYPLLESWYDRILVYGDRGVFDPVAAYGMSETTAARTRFCGYLEPEAPRRSAVDVRQSLGAEDKPLVVVSTGGGADGGTMLKAFLSGLRERKGKPLTAYVVTGPLLSEDQQAELADLATGIADLKLTRFDPDFAAAVRAADVVVSMGGYNSLVEAVHFGKRPIVVPRVPGPEEQLLRAEGFARRGLATLLRPEALSPQSLWSAIDAELGCASTRGASLPFGGLDAIAEELDRLVRGGISPFAEEATVATTPASGHQT